MTARVLPPRPDFSINDTSYDLFWRTDPRPDLVADSTHWHWLLSLAQEHDRDLLGALHGMRCMGAMLDIPGVTIIPPADPDDRASYTTLRPLLTPHADWLTQAIVLIPRWERELADQPTHDQVPGNETRTPDSSGSVSSLVVKTFWDGPVCGAGWVALDDAGAVVGRAKQRLDIPRTQDGSLVVADLRAVELALDWAHARHPTSTTLTLGTDQKLVAHLISGREKPVGEALELACAGVLIASATLDRLTCTILPWGKMLPALDLAKQAARTAKT